ncbi:93027673-43b6-41d2-b256-75e1ec013e5e [Sclerotinia trifoliorum]|uniref:Elongator complex protein 5 n=1 Tax=Sclerotinia trifoliorum TaxID=28548 RepID=A0A8H2ZQK5_9HELO|nr:93027673-43b6-41d2-b256-75e1ec013e5e [Sclerotinia trifoliorum]
MAPSPLQQRRTHNTLLFQKLLNLRDGASPFTLILDSLEQSGRLLVREFWRRALISKSKVIFISFSTLQKRLPFTPDVFVSAHGKPLSQLRREIVAHLPSPTTPPSASQQKTLLIIDNLHPLTSHPDHLSPFLSSLIIHPSISLLCTHHLDIPLPPSSTNTNPYTPNPLTTLLFLATAILSPYNFTHELARKRARDKSAREPEFGIAEGKEGVIRGFGNGHTPDAKNGEIVLTLEMRRKSGRGTRETFIYTPPPHHTSSPTTKDLGTIQLLDEHPAFAAPEIWDNSTATGEDEGMEADVTFNLGLTEKQKRDRENVVLPYFDAQKEGGIGSGGKILYEMGAEDREDFDDEEDEI